MDQLSIWHDGMSSLGITAGLSRIAYGTSCLWSNLAIKNYFNALRYFAVQNSILFWASGHRTHHRHVDDVEKYLHSINNGFWYAHIGVDATQLSGSRSKL